MIKKMLKISIESLDNGRREVEGSRKVEGLRNELRTSGKKSNQWWATMHSLLVHSLLVHSLLVAYDKTSLSCYYESNNELNHRIDYSSSLILHLGDD